MIIEDLNEKAVDRILCELVEGIISFVEEEGYEEKIELLSILVNRGLENSDDFFGTEGWERYFNI